LSTIIQDLKNLDLAQEDGLLAKLTDLQEKLDSGALDEASAPVSLFIKLFPLCRNK